MLELYEFPNISFLDKLYVKPYRMLAELWFLRYTYTRVNELFKLSRIFLTFDIGNVIITLAHLPRVEGVEASLAMPFHFIYGFYISSVIIFYNAFFLCDMLLPKNTLFLNF